MRPAVVIAATLARAGRAASAPVSPLSNVFYPGLNATAAAENLEGCYAIPSLLFVPLPEPTLLAVVEAKRGNLCGDAVNSTLVMRRSSDYGATWGAPFFPYRPWADNRKWGQPQMVYDNHTRSALLLFSNETLNASPGTTQTLHSVLQITSTDAGLTWSEPTTVDTPDPSSPFGWAPTSGNGIQLVGGQGTAGPGSKYAGRLVFSMDTLKYGYDQVLYSDDHGKSYSRSGSLNSYPSSEENEFQLAELHNGSIIAVIRNVLGTHRQEVSISNDGGATFSPPRPHPDLWTPVCQSSVLSLPLTSDSPPNGVLLFAGPRSTTSRVNMTVLASLDGGNAFNLSLPIWPGKTGGYSAMQWLGRIRAPKSDTAPSSRSLHQQRKATVQGLVGTVALLFMRDGGNVSVALFDASAVNQPVPPPPPPPTPPVINSTCAAKLDAYCTALVESGGCIPHANTSCPSWAPIFGVWAPECGVIVRGPPCRDSCQPGVPPKPATWRCFSHLALNANRTWSQNTSDPVLGCTAPGLLQVYNDCMGTHPPPPPPSPPPTAPTGLRLSNVLGSGMVLQRSPASSRIWGVAQPGDRITVAVELQSPQGGVEADRAAIVVNTTANTTTGDWSVRLPPLSAGGPYLIKVTSTHSPATLILTDVLVGEVHVCSGQSNMDFSVAGVFNASNECAAVSNPMIRLFKTQRRTSEDPLHELDWIAVLNWTSATPETACGPEWRTALDRSVGFSAACYYYASELQQTLGVPIGVIHTAWGGTPIEAWMSAEAMAACPNHTAPNPTTAIHPDDAKNSPDGTPPIPTKRPQGFPSESSVLYNAMISPLTPMVTAGFLWWQGESNAYTVENAFEYGCNQKAMINDLRRKFDATPLLPFVFVQSFPLYGNLSQFQPYPGAGTVALEGLSQLRLSQATSLTLPNVGMACTIDLGDVGSPFTWQHNRAKKACAHRATLAARAIIYNETTLVHRSPEPESVTVSATTHVTNGVYFEVTIQFNMHGSAGLHQPPVPISVLSFEVLLSTPTEGRESATQPRTHSSFHEALEVKRIPVADPATPSYWVPATVLPAQECPDGGQATVKLGVSAFFSADAKPVALRYAHGDFPTGIVHTVEGLPVGPFLAAIES
eukprot:m.7949 g.7949  ORF g.7949 m.7949 type:complete len:1118 (+) comp4006_c0_seq1:170-3523(+)